MATEMMCERVTPATPPKKSEMARMTVASV